MADNIKQITGDTDDFYAPRWAVYNNIKKTEFTPINPYDHSIDKEEFEWIDVYYFFYRGWHNYIKSWHHDIKCIWQNLCTYLPIIWSNRDWDNGYLNELMLVKMKRMQISLRSHVAEGPHHAALDRCVVLLEELIKRDGCDCAVLSDPRASSKDRAEYCIKCYKEQEEMLLEFGEIFGRFNKQWWD